MMLPKPSKAELKGKSVWSATQLTTADDCKRKHYFLYKVKIPQLPAKHFDFGTVLHECAERYLGATLQGEVPLPKTGWTTNDNRVYLKGPYRNQTIGDPVDLFPVGWDELVSPSEASLIKILVLKAIDEGVLARQKVSWVETEFWLPIADSWLVGYIDHFYEWTVEDHKTTSDFRWALGPKKLATAIPMLVYAKGMLEIYKHSPLPDTVTLRHNYFLKDSSNPTIRKVDVPVSVEDVYASWNTLQEFVTEVESIYEGVESWEEVPGPEDKNICNKYGGCPAKDICTQRVKLDTYIKRTNKLIENYKAPVKGHPFEGLPTNTMGLLDNRFKKTTEPAATASLPPPPWAYADCTTKGCEGSGWNSKGDPCRICMQMTEFDMDSHELTIGNGKAILSKDDEVIGTFSAPAKQEEVKVQEKSENTPASGFLNKIKKAPAIVEEEEEEMPEQSEVKDLVIEEIEIEPAKGRRGRPKKSFTLAINCAPIRGTGTVRHLEVTFKDLCGEIAKAKKVKSYYLINVWERRDLMASQAETIAEELGKDTYIAVAAMDGDFKHFIDIIRPYATCVWEPFAGTTTIVVEDNAASKDPS